MSQKRLVAESAVIAATGVVDACPDLFRATVEQRVKRGEDWRVVATSEFMYLVSLLKYEDQPSGMLPLRSLSDPGPRPKPPSGR